LLDFYTENGVCLNIMHDLAGWLLLLFSFSIVLMWKSIRDDTKVVYAIWFCLVLHHAVVFMDMYFPDASTFHGTGVHLAASPEPEWLHSDSHNGAFNYINSLGFLYRALGASLFFGEELSVLAFVLSCVVLVKLVDHLDLRRFRVGIVLFFGLLPSKVIFESVTLREPWQALFFLLFVYWTIRLRKRLGILILLFMLMSAFCMSLLHHGLARYAVYLIVISLYWCIFSRRMCVRWPCSVRVLFAGLLIACVIISSQKMGLFMTLGEAVERGAELRRTLLSYTDVRTNFSTVLDASSVRGIVTTVPMIFVEYMFAPYPWQVENVKDICALLESMLRFVLLFFAVFLWSRSSGEVRSYYGFLLIVVLGMELVWALGTSNWGTAPRHHVPGYGVIVLLGAPGLFLFMRELHFRIFGRRKVSGELNEQMRHMS
jgi:hypothetical protein